MIIPGNNRVIAADAYNGAPLWSIDVPESRRAGVYRDSSWLAARDESVYVAAAARCLRLDASTGKLQTSYSIPGVDSTVSVEWGYVAVIGKQLFGSRQRKGASRREHSLEQINEGTYYDARPLVCSDELFSLAAGNGETKWRYAPESGVIVNSTIAVADDRVYLIESSGLPAKVSKTGRYRASELFRETEKLTALNMKSGDVLWQELLDLSRLEHVVYLCAVDNRVVLAGSYNRRIGKQPTVHFDISVHDGSTGNRLWSKTQNQGTKAGGAHGEQDLHPVIVGDTLFCEPFAYSLSTGTPLAEWKWNRNHRRGCGTVSASATSFFFRHANPTMFDLTGQEYLKITTCTRPGCWINMIPAGGLLLVPEGSSGCTCHYAVQSSMAFLPAGGE